jgi:hypothetical protein
MAQAPRSGYALPVDPLNELGDPADAFTNPKSLQYVRQLVTIIRAQFGKFIARDVAAPFITLQSPGGKTFRITVDDTGTVTATDARGG